VILDCFDADKYSNGNFALFGMSGAGKTFTSLVLALRFRMQNIQVMAIVPEKGFEYLGACVAVGGQFIRLAPGSQDCINPLEIRRTTLDIDADLQNSVRRSDSVLLDQLQQLHTWFDLADPDITKEQHHLLDAALFDTYRSFGIDTDNRSLTIKKGAFKPMPDLTHLLAYVKEIPELKNIALTIERLIGMGFGRQTNVRLASKFIVFDTSKMPKEWNALGMFTATRFVKDAISVSRVEKKAVFMDEGWKIAGVRGSEEAADFVIELVKTIRGFGGIFISATQNVIDYFALQEGRFGKSLLGNSRIKLLLQMEEAEALEIKDKLGLSDEETMQITRSGRGQGLLCAGPNRIAVEIRSTAREFEAITTSRTDLLKRKK
jgi:type IV secretory pathway VirB4 component